MTSQSPRIYTYKITFEEVPYYYYGVHKEKRFNEEYWGSPVTNKWCWELYTPKKQILEIFDYIDDGWEMSVLVEKRLIKPFLNDEWCLNERCGSVRSLKTCIKGGKIQGTNNKENGTGFFTMSKEERVELSRKNGLYNKENKIGICGLTPEQRSQYNKISGKIGGKKGGRTNAINKTGVCGRSKEKMSADGKKGGTASVKKHKELGIGFVGMSFEQRRQNGKKANETHKRNGTGVYALTHEDRNKMVEKVNSQKWMCLETGHISNPGALAKYQRARGIDTSKRKRIE